MDVLHVLYIFCAGTVVHVGGIPQIVRPLYLSSNSEKFLKWHSKRLASPDGVFGIVSSVGHCARRCIKHNECGSYSYNINMSQCMWSIEPLFFQEMVRDESGWTTFTREKGKSIVLSGRFAQIEKKLIIETHTNLVLEPRVHMYTNSVQQSVSAVISRVPQSFVLWPSFSLPNIFNIIEFNKST